MKNFVFLLISIILFSCKPGISSKQKNYSFDELTVNFVSNTRVVTFIENNKPISGTVTQELRSGGKTIWEVDKGLAVKQTTYYPDGQLRRMLELKNGVEHGTYVMYYPDGHKFQEQFYENGKPTGTWHRWNTEGELVETIEH